MRRGIGRVARTMWLCGLVCLSGCVWTTHRTAQLEPEGADVRNVKLHLDRDVYGITAEGPVWRNHGVMEIRLKGEGGFAHAGEGEFPGRIYTLYDDLKVLPPDDSSDCGFVVIDDNGEFLYVNLYSYDSPDEMEPHAYNGRYRIVKAPTTAPAG